jgi:DNA repair protein RadA
MKDMTELEELTTTSLPGTSAGTIKKILAVDITTIKDLADQNPKLLAKEAGMGEDTAEKAIKTAISLVEEGWVTGKQVHEKNLNRQRLHTGSKALDKLLHGGIEEQTTTEIAGKNGSGKTQLCHTLAVMVQLPVEEGGLDGKAVWIDTEGTFRPERILEICESRGLDGDKILEGIIYGEAYHSQHQKMLINALPRQCTAHNIKLVIVDSVMAHLRGEYLGRGMLSERQNLLSDMLKRLGKIARTHNLTVVYTNQMMDDPGKLFQRAAGKAVGGNIMGHAAFTRMEIRKGRLEKRIVALTKSPYLPEGEIVVRITERGVEDVEDYEPTED